MQASMRCRILSNGHASTRPRAVTTHAAPPRKTWEDSFRYLSENQLRSLQAEEAKEMVDSGSWVLIDVRPQSDHGKCRPKGSVNVPLFQDMDFAAPDVAKVLKWALYAMNGVAAVEPNPNFIASLQKAAAGKKGIITACEAGGTLRSSTNFPSGKASRSLTAAYKALTDASLDVEVAHLDRGLYGWFQADLEFEGTQPYKPDIGRTPNAAADPTLQNVSASTGYSMLPGDKK